MSTTLVQIIILHAISIRYTKSQYPTACPGCLDTGCSTAGFCGNSACGSCDGPGGYGSCFCGSGGSFCCKTPAPTKKPTPQPTTNPTKNPTNNPSKNPTIAPSITTFNPSKTPTSNPTLNPSIAPTKNPTSSPTLPEGAVESDDGNNNNQGDDIGGDSAEQKSINSSNALLNGNLIYIIIGAIGLLLCCIIFAILFYKNRKKQKLETTNEMNIQKEEVGTNMINMTNIPNGTMKVGSISPRSINSVGLTTAGGDMDEGDTNSISEDTDDDNNDLFGITGTHVGNENVTRGGDDQNEVQLPELPNNNEFNDEVDEDNAIYNNTIEHVTTGGYSDRDLDNKPVILNELTKSCDQCGKSVEENGGKLDENDGNWYCNDCWEVFE